MKYTAILMTSLALALSAHAGWQGSASAEYAVKATVDSFTGKATSEPITIADGAPELPVTFQIARMETGKKKRDVEMQHMFGADQHPYITGLAQADAVMKVDGAGEVPVTLSIAGRTQELMAKISDVKNADGKLTFTAYLEISLKSFGLKPPSIMKIINVGDVVKVTTKFELTETAAAQP
jgi:polyisoprenoid-binding protein YceI